MAKDPAVLFYTSDFLSGTSFFSMEDRGKYITLLCEQHQNGRIPENHMIFICESYDSPVIKKFKKDENGFYYNERMEEEREKRSSYCKSRSNNKSGRPTKKSYDNHMNNHMSLHMENGNENDNDIVLSLKDRDSKGEEIYKEFKKVYPSNGSAVSEEVRRQLRTLVANGVQIDLIIGSAKAYSEYCQNQYPKSYPYEKHISQALNWLNREQYNIHWDKMTEEKTKTEMGTHFFD